MRRAACSVGLLCISQHKFVEPEGYIDVRHLKDVIFPDEGSVGVKCRVFHYRLRVGVYRPNVSPVGDRHLVGTNTYNFAVLAV